MNGIPRIGVFAGPHGIQAGDEVTYDYNFTWFPGADMHSCRCGSTNCSGVMGKRGGSKSVSSSASLNPDQQIPTQKQPVNKKKKKKKKNASCVVER